MKRRSRRAALSALVVLASVAASVACTREPVAESKVPPPPLTKKAEVLATRRPEELPRGFDALLRKWPELSAVQYGLNADLSPWFSGLESGVLYARIDKSRPCEVLQWQRVDGEVEVRVLVRETADERSYRRRSLSPVLMRQDNVLDFERKAADGSWHEEEGFAVGGPEAEPLGVLTGFDGEVAWYAGVEMNVYAYCAGTRLDACGDEPAGCDSCDVLQMSVFEKIPLGRRLAMKGPGSDLPLPSDECLAACGQAMDSSELYRHVSAELGRMKQESVFWKRRDPRDSPAIYRSQARCEAAAHGLSRAQNERSPE